MGETRAYTLAWLGELMQMLRLPPDLVIQPVVPDSGIPPLEFGSELPAPHELRLPISSDNQEEWWYAWGRLLTHETWNTCFINLLGVPPRTLMTTRDQTRWQDSAAVLIETLCTAAPDHVVATLCPSGLLTDNRHAPLRAWLAHHHRLEWLVYLGSAAAQPLGVHPSFRMTLLLIRTGPAHEGEQRLLRLADLTELERPEWRKVLANAAKRGGGEAGPSIILRNP